MPFSHPLYLETRHELHRPLKDMLFDIEHLANIGEIAKLPGFEDVGLETAQAVLEECARFNQDVVAPLNIAGDRDPSSFKGGEVTTTPMPTRASRTRPSTNSWCRWSRATAPR